MFGTRRARTEPIQYSDGTEEVAAAWHGPLHTPDQRNEKPSDRTEGLRNSTLYESLMECTRAY
jgi:hypothetical protein